jgi:hypothetical protein
MTWTAITVIAFAAAVAAIVWAVALYRSGDPAWRGAASTALAAAAAGLTGVEPRMPWVVVSIVAFLGSVILMWTFSRAVDRAHRAHLGEGTDA